MNTKLPPIHPGEVLLEDFMKPLNLSAYRVAKDIGMSPIAITRLTQGRRALSPQTALLLARYFGNSPEVWIRLQAQYDLEIAREKIAERLVQVLPAPNPARSEGNTRQDLVDVMLRTPNKQLTNTRQPATKKPKKIKDATLELTVEENDRLMRTGYVKISDPERGEIEVRMLFDEDRPGPKGKRLSVNVLKPGPALRGTLS